VHLINAAAFNEFSAALKSLSGQSDLQVRGSETYFDETLYPTLAQHAGVSQVNPVLQIDAGIPGQRAALTVLGVDVFRAHQVTPDLVGIPADGKPLDMLADDTIFISPAAMEWLQVKTGDTLALTAGPQTVKLRVAGGLLHARVGQRIAVMDIGAAQWRFQKIGKLSRIDLKLEDGVNREAFKATLAQELAGRYLVSETVDDEARTANMSRAYRVNLTVLALVALFTGAFLVFSTQTLSVIRRRQQFAFLRVMGFTRKQLMTQILLEGSVLGIAGSLIGLALGYALAAAALHFFGGDLGGGYFPGIKPSAQFAPVAAGVFFALGVGIALLGSASPAWEAARAKPAAALKSGSEDGALSKLSSPLPGLLLLVTGVILTRLPPVMNLPLFGYLAVALLLIGAIALMPRLSALVFTTLANRFKNARTVAMLTLARLANTPNQASIALGGILSSFSLMVAMAIMVASFRVSVDDWLQTLLTADLYVRTSTSGNSGGLTLAQQQQFAHVPGIASYTALRATQISLDPDRPSVALLAREIDVANPGEKLPMVGDALPPDRVPAGTLPAWVSEAMIDLYHWQPGMQVPITLGGQSRKLFIAGIWRDYARQTGSIQMRLSDYRAVTGDDTVGDMALRVQQDFPIQQVMAEIRKLPFGENLDLEQAGQIRTMSLNIFDRSFAVTYLLEAVAMIIGLFGIAATFSAQTFARAKEFGMLRHIGVTRSQILRMLAMEGGLLAVIGIAAGFVLGLGISLILVFVVNPQSFHWSMRLHMPWALICSVAMVLLISAALTALIAGRYAVSGSAVQAVREDW
jgi:putative ABC transport system permease protein